MNRQINVIKAMFHSMNDGEITASAYDTAWVAQIEDINGTETPQFPSTLQWIVENQLADGSWGDCHIFSVYDRLINTLACVIALKSWKIYPERCEKGLSFIREHMRKLEDEDPEHMLIGFEVAFPSLIEIARTLNLELPYDCPVLQDIYAKRDLKLNRIPKELLHKVPTTVLHSMEGMEDLDWEKLLRLQLANGSFMFSPSSTAYAFMHTKDEKCLGFLKKTVERFNGRVPTIYPLDLFEHLWAVDRLERLGISRFFEPEIEKCLNYVYRYWTEDGIFCSRNSSVQDVDDTAMGFRLLRLHGYDVAADAFRQFQKGPEFFCFAGQSSQAVTGILNLNRASQVLFPREKILEEAKTFSYKFLREKQASNQIMDKWLITRDLPGEVEYALDFPWYASLPGIEACFYLEHYGREDDVWIGKTLYRMPYVNNNTFLKLAKLDFNNSQAMHQLELLDIQKWYAQCNLQEFGLSKQEFLRAYFLVATSIPDPERATQRLAWARTAILIEAILSYVGPANMAERRKAFLQDYFSSKRSDSNTRSGRLIGALLKTLNILSLEARAVHGRDVHHQLKHWDTWMLTLQAQEDSEDNGNQGNAELLVHTINLCSLHPPSEELSFHPHYAQLTNQINIICHHLLHIQKAKGQMDDGHGRYKGSHLVDSEMQKLVQFVLQCSHGLASNLKQTFLTVTKSFYYAAYCDPATLQLHIAKFLFEAVA
ncbi:(-)-kolavenyl diphosphate synthase TPS28, chloroplastic-like [Tasmannia lanceolata]|uniref:(-)-kolavenyl diphosphate synthase TPS28, chloroplastic-like n=1 Tax=Tasmannia lanceolata TaxID=3420 RepID=UPI0040632464